MFIILTNFKVFFKFNNFNKLFCKKILKEKLRIQEFQCEQKIIHLFCKRAFELS